MSDDDLCMHLLAPGTCSICKSGPTLRSAEPELPVTECASCPAEVMWVVTEKGKRMPIDAVPDPINGRFRIESGNNVHFVKDSELEANTKPLYASHFQSCPDAKSWKRSR